MAEAASFTVDVSGLIADLQKLGRMAEGDAVSQALMAGGAVVEGAGKENIIKVDFIDTGATLNSVAPEMHGNKEVRIGPSTDYAIYGELGTRYMAARPFMRPALEENKEAINQAIAESLRNAIRRAL